MKHESSDFVEGPRDAVLVAVRSILTESSNFYLTREVTPGRLFAARAPAGRSSVDFTIDLEPTDGGTNVVLRIGSGFSIGDLFGQSDAVLSNFLEELHATLTQQLRPD